jgi:hypothetical protein
MTDNPFEEYTTFAKFGAMLPKPRGERTVDRYTKRQKDPLPYVDLPGGKTIHKPTGFAWYAGLMRMRNSDRRRRRKR